MFIGQDKFKIEALELLADYPKLELISEEDSLILSGDFELYDESNILLDSYKIKVCPTETYPFQFPIVFETSKRLPFNTDWHVYPDGHLCIRTIPEEKLTCANGITLKYFLEDELKPYLFNQLHRRILGYFKNERSHGVKGEIEFYESFFNTKDLLVITSYLIFIATNKEPNRSSKCFCNRGKLYRKCHRDAYRKMKQLGNDSIIEFLTRIVYSPFFLNKHPIEAMNLRLNINPHNNLTKSLI